MEFETLRESSILAGTDAVEHSSIAKNWTTDMQQSFPYFEKPSQKLACEYSRLSFAPATTCKTRIETSAIHGQKFHTDDVNLSRIRTGALIGQLGNLHNVCEIYICMYVKSRVIAGCYCGPKVHRVWQDYEDTPEQ